MSLFGTDGIRGTPNRSPLTAEQIVRIGQAYATFLNQGKVFLCRDTRSSGIMMKSAIVAGLSSAGSEVLDAGILNTPAAAYLTRNLRLDGAVVISASHNPSEENGIKFFTGKGRKLNSLQEKKIEEIYNSNRTLDAAGIGQISSIETAKNRYVNFASATVNPLEGIKAVVDCSNGAAYETAPMTLAKSKVQFIALNTNPDGYNINKGCGSEHPKEMAKQVVKEKADIGIALDGDADRVVLADETGKIISGDQLIGIAAISMSKKGKLKKNAVVVTHYSNFGLEKALNNNGINVIRSNVGDQAVAEKMEKQGINLGGEQSGHVIFSQVHTTGDGILTALQIMKIMKEENKKLSELAGQIMLMPQVMLNVKVKNKKPIEETNLKKAIEKVKQELEGTGRVFIRYSGTQSLLRIMVEGKNEKQINKLAQELARNAEKELG